ncbi:LysE family translocator [Stappia sp.]|uniref:LysE family translocator n=1 Tax=Stappia sp. TaxID=1870903 RepID=UPI003A98D869
MSPETILALAGFAFVMSVSPGPGNFLLLASGANFGLLRTLPLILGISFGFLSMVLAVGLGLGQLLHSQPVLTTGLRLACAAYIVWLAWRIAGSRSIGSHSADGMETPFTFLQASALQLLNPKAWTVALIVTVSYLPPEAPVSGLLLLIAIFAAVNIPSIGLWAISGHGLRSFLSAGRRLTVFNITMAFLLIVSMLPTLVSIS